MAQGQTDDRPLLREETSLSDPSSAVETPTGISKTPAFAGEAFDLTKDVAPPQEQHLKVGACVDISGLSAKPELNGQQGHVIGVTPAGRIIVSVNGNQVALRPENVTAADDDEVLLRTRMNNIE